MVLERGSLDLIATGSQEQLLLFLDHIDIEMLNPENIATYSELQELKSSIEMSLITRFEYDVSKRCGV